MEAPADEFLKDEEFADSHPHILSGYDQDPVELLTRVGEGLVTQFPAQATRYFVAALSLDPTFSRASYHLGKLALREGRYAEAVKSFGQSLRHNSAHAPTHYLISLAYWGLGEPEAALRSANTALRHNPLNAAAFLQKLRSLAALQRWDELDRSCQHLFANLSQTGEVYLWHALAKAHLGDFNEARTLYAQALPRARHRHPELTREVESTLS